MLRVGIGHDVHAFAPAGERPLVLGGVVFPGERGLAGHSDADVVIHAICDAVLGALALGDIGKHFPDTDPRYTGISSLELLRRTAAMMAERGWRVVNLDAVILAESPRIAPRSEEMRGNVAAALGAEVEDVSLKGKRPEGLGALGRREGISCHAVVLLGRAGA
jgi:2-C-methyl-D-erythritol 2,4-cyclodiphosphate synthase